MNKFRIKFWTGPMLVGSYARHVLDHLDKTTTNLKCGTHHIYFTVEGRDITDAHDFAARVLSDFSGDRPVLTISPIIEEV
jgi:hypothetical protein